MPENIQAPMFRKKQPLSPIYCRTTLKRKSLTNSLRIAHNWLMELKLIPMNLKDLPAITVKNYIMKFFTVFPPPPKFLKITCLKNFRLA